jgi:hypothetical protein
MVTTAPLPTPRVDPTPRAALRAVHEQRVHGQATVKEWIIAKHGDRPRDLWLRMLLRVSDD